MHRLRLHILLAVICAALFGMRTSAHPMGNFAICHYAKLSVNTNRVDIVYVLDFAEIPSIEELRILDSNHDGKIDSAEEAAYVKTRGQQFVNKLQLKSNRSQLQVTLKSCRIIPSLGAGGLQTLRIEMLLQADCAIQAETNFTYLD